MNQDEAKCGMYADASQLTRLSGSATERRVERQRHVQNYPHYQCRRYIEDIREKRCNLFDGLTLECYRRHDHLLHVQILQVCRQVYIEANPILWSSNTLAFNKPQEFGWFMSERIAAQKASIASLLLDLSHSGGYRLPGESQNVATNGIINALVGLRTLHLYIQNDLPRLWRGVGQLVEVNLEIEQWQRETKDRETRKRFTAYKRLPLENVTVLMVDRRPYGYTTGPEWLLPERAKYAETIREAILQPDGPKIYQQEQATAKAELEAEEALVRLNESPCPNASIAEECARLHQENLNSKKAQSGNHKSAKPKARACKLSIFVSYASQCWMWVGRRLGNVPSLADAQRNTSLSCSKAPTSHFEAPTCLSSQRILCRPLCHDIRAS